MKFRVRFPSDVTGHTVPRLPFSLRTFDSHQGVFSQNSARFNVLKVSSGLCFATLLWMQFLARVFQIVDS